MGKTTIKLPSKFIGRHYIPERTIEIDLNENYVVIPGLFVGNNSAYVYETKISLDELRKPNPDIQYRINTMTK